MVSSLLRLNRLLMLVALIASTLITSAFAVDKEKHDDIAALLEATGGLKLQQQLIDAMLPKLLDAVAKANSSIPQSIMDEFKVIALDEFRKSLPEMTEPMITLYDAHFSADEVKQLLAFYKSPLGQKVTSELPQLLQQSIQIGQGWGQKIVPRVIDRIKIKANEKGYKI